MEVKGEYGSLVYYVKEKPREIALGALFLLLFAFSSYKIGRMQYFKGKIKKLREEEQILNELIKVIQTETFKENKMSIEEYQEAMFQYDKKITEIVEDLINFENKQAYNLKFAGEAKRLEIEKEKVIELLKHAQQDFLEKGTIDDRIYKVKTESYNRRIGEIDSQLAEIEAEKALKKIGFFGKSKTTN